MELYSRQEIADILQINLTELNSTYLKGLPEGINQFKLRQRAEHVFTEAQRVYTFKHKCSEITNTLLLTELGSLMNDSHKSCAELFECSCPELDALTTFCRNSGAVGSRLTGAGWGGCTVSLVPQDHLHVFLEKLKSYYSGKTDNISSVLFVTQPGQGAALIPLSL